MADKYITLKQGFAYSNSLCKYIYKDDRCIVIVLMRHCFRLSHWQTPCALSPWIDVQPVLEPQLCLSELWQPALLPVWQQHMLYVQWRRRACRRCHHHVGDVSEPAVVERCQEGRVCRTCTHWCRPAVDGTRGCAEDQRGRLSRCPATSLARHLQDVCCK